MWQFVIIVFPLPTMWIREKWVFAFNLQTMQQNAPILKLSSKMLLFWNNQISCVLCHSKACWSGFLIKKDHVEIDFSKIEFYTSTLFIFKYNLMLKYNMHR